MDDSFVETTGTVARKAGVVEATIRRYCNEGLLEFMKLDTGIRLLKPSAVERARKLKAERRGGRPKREAA